MPTNYTDAATVSSKTTPSGPGLFAVVDADTPSTVTTVNEALGVEVGPYYDSDTVESITEVVTGLGTDVGPYYDSATVKSVTTLVGSYLTESFTIHTVDYNMSTWSIPYTFDGSNPVSGYVGAFDTDNGEIT